ncbi:MAG: STAS domain-containing protein [Acidiferrobacterales bacterium]
MSLSAGNLGGVRAISGPLVFDSVPEVYAATKEWFTGSGELVLDLAAVTQVDSAGLGLVIEWLRLARASGRALKFVNMPAQMQVLVSVNGLQDILFKATAT